MRFSLWLLIFVFLLGAAAMIFYILVVIYHLLKPVKPKRKKGSNFNYKLSQMKEVRNRI